MADMKSANNLDKWRTYFQTCDSNIFDIIENGIRVAAADFPQEFKSRRVQIAQTLYSSTLNKCAGCGHDVELVSVPSEERKVEERRNDRGGNEYLGDVNKEDCKVDGGSDDQNGKMNGNQIEHHYNCGDAEALGDESQIINEVLRIKETLLNCENEDGSFVLEILMRLESMHLSFKTLQATGIRWAVNFVRNHASGDVAQIFAWTLNKAYKVVVDDWISAGGLEGDTPESVNPSNVGEAGLPPPPLEDVAAHNRSRELSQCSKFLDGLDNGSNPRNREESNKKTENGRKPRVEGDNTPKRRQQAESVAPKFKKEEPTKKEEACVKKQATILKPNKPPSILESRAGGSAKPSLDHKALSETRLQKKPNSTSQRPPLPPQNKRRYSKEDAAEVKLERTKRKLRESYLQAENAKKQRTVQVVELHDLPDIGLGGRNPHVKPSNDVSNHKRQQRNNRR